MKNISLTAPYATRLDRIVVTSALVASVLVLAMFLTFIVTGIGQDPLQYFHPPAEYSSILLQNPPILKFAIGLDNGFIVAYSTIFLALGGALWRSSAIRLMLVPALGLLAASALLDLAENMHFLSMISAAQQGITIGPSEINAQVVESLIKFHASYLGLFLLGLALPAETRMERLFRFLLLWVQLPVGILIYLVPPSVAVPLVLVRFSFFLVAVLLIAGIFRGRGFGSNAPA
jgi:hypothetical protein